MNDPELAVARDVDPAHRFSVDEERAREWLGRIVAAYPGEAEDISDEAPTFGAAWHSRSDGAEWTAERLVRGAVEDGILICPDWTDVNFSYEPDSDGGSYHFTVDVGRDVMTQVSLNSWGFGMDKLGNPDTTGVEAALSILDEAVHYSNKALDNLALLVAAQGGQGMRAAKVARAADATDEQLAEVSGAQQESTGPVGAPDVSSLGTHTYTYSVTVTVPGGVEAGDVATELADAMDRVDEHWAISPITLEAAISTAPELASAGPQPEPASLEDLALTHPAWQGDTQEDVNLKYDKPGTPLGTDTSAYPELDDADLTPAAEQGNWQPTYSPWRHGGWYVNNIRYPGGAVGCVSRNYPDGKWRIVCDDRPDAHDLYTYPDRDAAAQAERELAAARWERVAELAAGLAPVTGPGATPNTADTPCAVCGTVVKAGKGLEIPGVGVSSAVLDSSCSKVIGREQDDPGGAREAPAGYAQHVGKAHHRPTHALAAQNLPNGPAAGLRPDSGAATSRAQSARSSARKHPGQSPQATRKRGPR